MSNIAGIVRFLLLLWVSYKLRFLSKLKLNMNYITCKTNAITSLSRHYHLPHSAHPKFLQESPSGAIFICYFKGAFL